MINKYLTNTIEPGLVIAKGEKYIASRARGERYFASVWIGCPDETDKAWKMLLEEVAKDYNYEIINQHYPRVDEYRDELLVGEGR